MYYGIYTANFGDETTPTLLAELVAEPEDAGWDGFFLWDHIVYSRKQILPLYDPWVTLAGIAMRTERIRIGTGFTWWLESLYRWRNTLDGTRRRIRQGPPRL